MPTGSALSHYALLTAMLAPAFFLTATASLLMSANNRLARVIDRARTLLRELSEADTPDDVARIERWITVQRLRSNLILRASQLLYVAIAFFVATSLMVAADSALGYVFGLLPTGLAGCGVLAIFASSMLLAREASLAVSSVKEEMDHGYAKARRRPGPMGAAARAAELAAERENG